ncbi:MAG: bifunctional diaminohydroxyphosphoribosylaminopyrimidine deaminase/5-amino-6-(5-phosphoribosylamino)uracil reductase RibD [Leptolyngbyaceae cyanobacterium T60_A2020_046]|nr:bifunctional diaminohydroxyphosphoribosylaminopyrimidine deaminase/5-amino-6-(5-phosphoribosylamino)uracil reductase RibD [Leptolyngbyaceae cyanobacterium T60_A2020_046]
MQRCIALARQAAGQTAPNPMVGSVIVQGDEVVGEGFHPKAGEPHAEVFALRAAGDRARGATLYVNLEPCNHTGRTPPCTEAILAAGIRRVVVGMVDPDPRVSGNGLQRLKAAGLEVLSGVEEADCQRLNEAFVHRVTQHRPFGILKYAMTLDGKIAATGGHSAWVTGPAARQRVHQLRARCDAVIVGGQTVRADNPHLTTHGQSDRAPLRVVMSRRLALPTQAHLWQVETAPTVVFCGADRDRDIQAALEDQGVEVVVDDAPAPRRVLENLYARGHAQVLWECGGQLAAHAIATGCVQRVWAFVAPKWVGGAQAPTPIGELGIVRMDQAISLTQVSVQSVGDDTLFIADVAALERSPST